ncbi:hypothetical protein [Undibacterium curvum]|uniref:hypothetical protein n=1 Tax=Undibacterium curvum TaxID=2762294 RepID=UPI003D100433
MSSTLTNEVNKALHQLEKTSAQKQALIQACENVNSQWERIIGQTAVNKAMLQLEKASAQAQALIQAYENVNSLRGQAICQTEALRAKVQFLTEASNQLNINQKEMINDISHHQPIPIQNHINVTIINHDVDEKDSDYD